jgi:hypothetical protein
MKTPESPAPRQSQARRTVLDRILNTPHLEQVVPRLSPDILHRVIQNCGLEDCGELVMLATPRQLRRIFDLDLWHTVQTGIDEQFDADRFGVWLEVLAESGISEAAKKVAELDPDLMIVGLAQHARVFECAMVTPYRTTDGQESTATHVSVEGLACDVGGYRLVAKRTDSWEAIVSILISLDAEHPDCFHRVMRGCRTLSNAGFERDGLDELLSERDQAIFDLSFDRERRRDKQGYVPPVQARAFLEAARHLRLGSDAIPAADPGARAYLRSFDAPAPSQGASPERAHVEKATASSEGPVEGAAELLDVLLEAGIISQQPSALLNGSQQDHSAALSSIRAHMQFLFDFDHAAYARRNEELTYLANTIVAGCTLQARPFTAQEAWDAAVAVCNLGLENYPSAWIATKSLPQDFLIRHDLVLVFQIGWTVLHKEVAMYAAERLQEVLAGLRCRDSTIQSSLDTLQVALSRCQQARVPWGARRALDVIAILDMPAWAALLGLMDEFPVLPAALSASRNSKARSFSASAFEFISENSQIASIRHYMQSLPETLRP